MDPLGYYLSHISDFNLDPTRSRKRLSWNRRTVECAASRRTLKQRRFVATVQRSAVSSSFTDEHQVYVVGQHFFMLDSKMLQLENFDRKNAATFMFLFQRHWHLHSALFLTYMRWQTDGSTYTLGHFRCGRVLPTCSVKLIMANCRLLLLCFLF